MDILPTCLESEADNILNLLVATLLRILLACRTLWKYSLETHSKANFKVKVKYYILHNPIKVKYSYDKQQVPSLALKTWYWELAWRLQTKVTRQRKVMVQMTQFAIVKDNWSSYARGWDQITNSLEIVCVRLVDADSE